MYLFIKKLRFPFFFLVFLAVVYIFSYIYSYPFSSFGLLPQNSQGFLGVFTAPLIHRSFLHFISNFIALAVLLTILFSFFYHVAYFVFICSYIIPGIFTWFIGRENLHIGASGIVYSLISFILLIGFFTKKREILAISFIILFLYGGFIWGMLPSQKGVSWEYHLGGFITGVSLAYFFRNFSFNEKLIPSKIEYSNQSSTASDIDYKYITNTNKRG